MKLNLLFEENNKSITTNEKNILRDLKLDTLLDVMAGEDRKLREICKRFILQPSNNLSIILKRQKILQDGIKHGSLFREIYQLAVQSLNNLQAYDTITRPKFDKIIPAQKKILTQSEIALLGLEHMKQICCRIPAVSTINPEVTSETLRTFFMDLKNHYTDEFFSGAIKELNFLLALKEHGSIIFGAHYGNGLKLTDLKLHKIIVNPKANDVKKRLFPLFHTEKPDMEIKIDNPSLENEIQELMDTGLYCILKSMSHFNREIRNLLEQMQVQFGFYTGAINLYHYLCSSHIPVTFPQFELNKNRFEFSELKDVFLVIKEGSADANTLLAQDKKIWIITGANQGGKTTFLRSIGLAQLMAQCGFFVAAEHYQCNIYNNIFTHFPEEEDNSLQSGLLDLELKKLNEIINHLTSRSLLLMNETFATTTEFDARYLAEELLSGLEESRITLFYVTHNYEFTHSLYEKNRSDVIFLRAQRSQDGHRNHKLLPGEPLKSSFALDLYREMMHYSYSSSYVHPMVQSNVFCE